ncbi:MAG: branched-chain amino acid ABC transporter permease [Solirubrobacteraceae bacterium]
MATIQTLVFGLVSGAYLIVATLGFALVSRTEKFLNIAHAELILAGAFVTYWLSVREGWPVAAAGAAAVAGMAVLSLVVGRLVYWPIRRSGHVVLLITSVGVVYVLHGILETAIEPGVYTLRAREQTLLDVGGVRLGTFDGLIVAMAIASVLVIHLLLTRTGMGLRLRARASDEALAAGRGVDVRRVSTHVWLIAGALAGLAGLLLSLRGAMTTEISFDQILLILSVSILAGFGSLYGVVAAALLLGVAMELSTLVIPAGYRTAIAFALVILVLIVRPEGISGAAVRRRAA